MSLKLFLMSDFFLLQIIEGKLKKNKKKLFAVQLSQNFPFMYDTEKRLRLNKQLLK